MQSNLDSSDQVIAPRRREPLAVIGIGCRLPGGIDSPVTFWDSLLRGLDAIGDVPKDRWKHERFHDANPEKSGYIRNAKGGFIDGVDQFDGEFFGYFPAEAQRIDPQQRLLLEVTHEAMEDAGVRRDQLDGSRTSVFIGSFMYDYLCMQTASEQRDQINPYVAMGTAVSPLANRISYAFNLKGPSISVDTACSSSLVAMHLACQSVWGGEADMAIAGGVNVMLRPESSIMLSKAGFLNPDQSCKAFDAAKNGYVRGEGVGVVILKPLSKALADGDAIYACVRGTAVNQDGYLPEGFTVPNVFSQVELLESVYAEAEIDPLKVDYVEAHGTGTPIGDLVESMALGSVLGDRDPEQRSLIIGSVKTNLGHLEGAAGITGFIKGVLTARHRVVPPNLHFNQPNPEIDWETLRLEVPTQPTELNCAGPTCTVGVNSFGAGGTNAHVVLQGRGPVINGKQALSNGKQTKPDGKQASHNGQAHARATLYLLSTNHKDSLPTLAMRHAEFLDERRDEFKDAAYSAFFRRSRYPHSVAVVGESAADIADRLRKFADGQVDPTTLTTTIKRRKEPKLAFVFSGQGGQWAQMGVRMMACEPVFRETVEEIDSLFEPLAGWSLLKELRKDDNESKVNDTVVVQPAVMAIQIGLVQLYRHYGIRPDAVVGHSIGEVAAAFASGALTLEQAVKVIYHRSQAQNLASGKGGMLAVGLSIEEAEKLIKRYGDCVSIGAVNGPEMLTLSGDPDPLQEIAETLEARGIFNRSVRVQVAYHSHHMDPIKDAMLSSLADVAGVAATTPLYSTVTGERQKGFHLKADYWFQNARRPVLFTSALNTMIEDGVNTFVEIGPHPVLVSGARALIKNLETDALIMPSMTRKEPESTVFLQSLGQLAARGLEPDAKVMFGSDRQYVRLPKNPWRHSRYWFESPVAAEIRQGPFEHPFLKRRTQMVTEDCLAVWDAALDVQQFPYLHDHKVDGEIVFPATGHLEMAWAVANEQFRHDPFFLEDLHFESALMLHDNSRHPLEARLEIVSAEGDFRICSRLADSGTDNPWTRHSSGRINTAHDRFDKSTASLDDIRKRFSDDDAMPVDSFYETIAAAGLAYGARFRCIEELHHCDHEMLARLRLPDELMYESQRNAIHPAVLDACIHVVFADVHRHGHPDRIFLPYRIDRVRIYRQPTQSLWAYVRTSRNDERFLVSDTLIFDDAGELVAEILGLVCKRLAGAGARETDSVYDGCYEYCWAPVPRDNEIHRRIFDYTNAVLIIPAVQGSAGEEVGAAIAKRLEADHIQPRTIRLKPEDSFDKLLSDNTLDRRTLIVFVADLCRSHSDWRGLADCADVSSLLQLAQTLHQRQGVPGLCLVTNGAAGVAGDQQLDLRQAILHGMARVINNECPNVPLKVIDLSMSLPPGEIDSLYCELLHSRVDQDESEIALRGEQRFVRQLMAVTRTEAEQAATSDEPGCGGAYRADVSVLGMLDQIAFRRQPPNKPGEDEVEIAVESAALNFKDVMNAMGLLPENAVSGGLACDRLGLEVAGRVLRTGKSVHQLQTGDEVIARVADGFGGQVTAPAHCVARRPSRLTPQQASAVPVVYITAWYSLLHLARMERGETVLVHSAAGGVGGAAIQLAQRAGARVIATAGTKEKRQFLKEMGVEHVFDSRSLDFYNQVMEVTGGRGVDIVLNSLTGRFITQSLKCLAPFGRFVELGKSDIYRNNKLGLERLGENISFFVVDVDRLAAQKPELHQRIMTDVVDLFERGELEPHEITEFPISKLPEAMKFMTRAAYRGKIVMNMQNDRVQALPPRRASFRSDRCYLITGGASGFGLEIARWMNDRGARHLVLLSRSGPKNDKDRAAIETMRSNGASVLLAQADIADRDAIDRVIEGVLDKLPPLAGVIHGAAVLDDASIPTMDMARFTKVFAPKAQGAWNLHAATAAADLDFFLTLSSISSVLGLVGQLNYAAANYFQDALAHYRRQQGLAATSVNLGVLGQYAGMSQAENDAQDIIGLLESHGMLVMPLDDVLAKLETALVQEPVQRMVSRFDWSRFRLAYPHLVRDTRFVELMSDAALARGSRPKGSSLRGTLAELTPDERRERVEQELAAKLGRILDIEPNRLDISKSIDALGLDSLMLTDLQVWMFRLLDVNLPLVKLLKGPSIASLAAELLTQLDDSDPSDIAVQEATPGSTTFTVADLDGVTVLNPWLIRGCGVAEAAYRLICFHSMGVGASLFTKFLLNPPDDFDILAVQTPGRENRLSEPVVESLDELVDQIVRQLSPLFDRPVVIWGHSYGGIVAHEVIRRLRERHQQEPAHYVVTGTLPPHLVQVLQKRDTLLKAMVVDNSPEYLISLSRYVDDPDFIKSILPLMRRDNPLLKSYRYQPTEALQCPITAFAARQDDIVYTDEIREWSQHTLGGFELIEVDGDHWFLNRNRELIIATLQGIGGRIEGMAAGRIVRSPTT